MLCFVGGERISTAHTPFEEEEVLPRRQLSRLFCHHLLLEDDARFRLLEVHVVHFLLILGQVALSPSQRLPIQNPMSWFAFAPLLRSPRGQQVHEQFIDMGRIDAAQSLARGGRTRKLRSRFRQHLLQPGTPQTHPLSNGLQRRVPGHFCQQHTAQEKRREYRFPWALRGATSFSRA